MSHHISSGDELQRGRVFERQMILALRSGVLAAVFVAALGACSASGQNAESDSEENASTSTLGFPDAMGARYDTTGTSIRFRVHSPRATHLEVDLYAQTSGADEVLAVPMKLESDTSDIWAAVVPASALSKAGLAKKIVAYGYRAWGPNWTYDPTWTKGSNAGFVSDVDASGNRFDPNKLLFDPFATELSHDPFEPSMRDGSVYMTGAHRDVDSGKQAPKGYVLKDDTTSIGTKPTRALKDDVIYETHVRGLTMQDPSVGAALRGTYAGAAQKASYLADLGVTAIEFLPIHESQNDTNDITASTDGDNYWDYSTLDYFAPDRRYSSDKSAGGPTRELKTMVAAFHARGIKVILDVVYNHTAEGGTSKTDATSAQLLSERGLDNPDYYELMADGKFSYDNTGTGGNFNTASTLGRGLIIDSLKYWKDVMGVDGFRFDLAPVLGNTCLSGCFKFDPTDPAGVLALAPSALPARPQAGGNGVDLIAEPWAASGVGSYQLGHFPEGWAEWNGNFRDTIRAEQNELKNTPQTPTQVLNRVTGSQDLFAAKGPAASVNFVDVHDGFTLHDLYAYDTKQNAQAWPYGPSSGGSDSNSSWDQDGIVAQQQQAARTGLALVMTSSGVPLFQGGDEMLRTQYGNNNAYNLDSTANWLDWSLAETNASFVTFTKDLIAFRAAHPALRPSAFEASSQFMLLDETGASASAAELSDKTNTFIAWRIAGGSFGDSARAIYIAYNASGAPVTATLPGRYESMSWWRALDTSANQAQNSFAPGQEINVTSTTYDLDARSIAVFVEHD